MITWENFGARENRSNGAATVTMELRGLSTDDKPVVFAGYKLRNGSIFIEIDTGKVYLFDEEGQQWNEV